MRLGQTILAVEPQVPAWVRTVQGLRDRSQDYRAAANELMPLVEESRRKSQELNQKRVALMIQATQLENQAKAIEQKSRTPAKRTLRGLGQHVGPEALLRAEAQKVLAVTGLGQIVELPPGFMPHTEIYYEKTSTLQKVAMAAAALAIFGPLTYFAVSK